MTRGALHIVGTGGHAKVVIAAARAAGFDVVAAYDDDPARHGHEVLGVTVVASCAEVPAGAPALLAIGSNHVRQRLATSVRARWTPVVHPSAVVHASAVLGPGTVVMAGAIIQPDALIGAHSIVNTGATIDHDCRVEDFVHIAPGVHLCGNVEVGEGTLVGVGAAVIPGRRVGTWATVGAGAAVVGDVPDRVTAVGVPARWSARRPT